MRYLITREFLVKALLVLSLLLILVLFVVYFEWIYDIIYPFAISIFIAYLLNPLVCIMERRGVKRSSSIILIYMIMLFVIFLICFYIMPLIVRDLGELVEILPEYNKKFYDAYKYIQEKYVEIGLPEGIKNAIENNINRIENSVTTYIEHITLTIIGYLSKVMSFALIPILLYYFLKDFNSIAGRVKLLIPRRYRNRITSICLNIDEIFGNYIRSQIILSIIIAVMTSIALLLLDIDFALIIGLVNGITNIIPYFGPIIGTVPAVLIALLQSPVKAIYVTVVMIIIQQIESDLISPKITANSVGLHPVSVIFALVIGGKLFGVMGMILGVPAAAALKVIYRDVMKSLF